MTGTVTRPVIIGVFPDPHDAGRAYDWLLTRGYDNDADVNVLMADTTLEEFKAAFKKPGDGSYTVGGAAVGAAIGATAATIVALAVPGLNVIAAGGLLAALGGVGAGTVTGGLIGGMIDLTAPGADAKDYEQIIHDGGVILLVAPHPGDEDDIRACFARNHGKGDYSAG